MHEKIFNNAILIIRKSNMAVATPIPVITSSLLFRSRLKHEVHKRYQSTNDTQFEKAFEHETRCEFIYVSEYIINVVMIYLINL